MKKKSLFYAVAATLVGSALAIVVATNATKLFATGDESLVGNHYAKKLATDTEAGWKEYWISCTTHEVFLEQPSGGQWTDVSEPQSGGVPEEGHLAYVAPLTYSISSDLTFTFSGKAPVASDYVTTNSDGNIVATWYDDGGNPLADAPTLAGSYKVTFAIEEGTYWAAKDLSGEGMKNFTIAPLTTNVAGSTWTIANVTNDDNNFYAKNDTEGNLEVKGWWLHLLLSGANVDACTNRITFLVKNTAKTTYRAGFKLSGNWSYDIDATLEDYNEEFKLLKYELDYATSVRTLDEFKLLLEGTSLTIGRIWFGEETPTTIVDGNAVSVSAPDGHGTYNDGTNLVIRSNGGSGDDGWFTKTQFDTPYVFDSSSTILKVTMKCSFARTVTYRFAFNNNTVQAGESVGTDFTTFEVAIPSGATSLSWFGFDYGNAFDYIHTIQELEFTTKAVTVNVDGTPVEVNGADGTTVSNDANGYLVMSDWWNCITFDNVYAPEGKNTLAIHFSTSNSYLYKVFGEAGAEAWQHGILADAGGVTKADDGSNWLLLDLDFSIAVSRKVTQINLCNTVSGTNTILEIEFR